MNFGKILATFLLCINTALPMVTSAAKAEKVILVRKALLARLVAEQKGSMVSFLDLDEAGQSPTTAGDIFLSHDPYELIGTNTGHLIIVNNSQQSCEKVKVHRDAVSCITAEGDIVATGSSTCEVIHRWSIGTRKDPRFLEIKMHDKISCQAPIIYMHTTKNLFIVIDILGNISLLDWKTGIYLFHIETEISKPILNTVINIKKGFIVIISPKTRILVKIKSLIELDTIICTLNDEQLEQIYQIITTDIDKDYTKIEDRVKLPYQIRELLTKIPNGIKYCT